MLQDIIRTWEKKWSELEETDILLEMAVEEDDRDTENEVAENLVFLEDTIAVA